MDISTPAGFFLSFLIHLVIRNFNSDLGNHVMNVFHHSKKTCLEVHPEFTLSVFFPDVTQGADSFGKALLKLRSLPLGPQVLQGWCNSSAGAWKASGTAVGERTLTLESRNEKTEVAEFIL